MEELREEKIQQMMRSIQVRIGIQFSLYETMIHSELYFVGSMSNLFGEKRIQEDGRAKVIIFCPFLVVNCFRDFLS